MTNCKIAYIGGGSRGWAWRLMADLAMEPELTGTIALYDIDFEAAKRNEIIGNRLSGRAEAVGKWKYEAVPTIEEALTGADFVIISIMPGTFDEMDSDVHAPEKYNIWQSVGDTVGPGGILRALRTIPMYVEIAEAIKAYAPDAWVINYTNPMSMCVKVLYHVFPEIKAFGCCHEVFGTQKILRNILQDVTELKDISRSEIEVNVVGINHFTWFTEAACRGIDLFPIYRDYVDAHYDTGYTKGDNSWLNKSFSSGQRVKFDLFRKYGAIAAAGDRHLAEFMPGTLYLNSPETVSEWMFALTTVDSRKKELKERLARSEALVNGEEEVKLEPSGEEGVILIKALCGLGRCISNVNIPNTSGQIPNLPRTAIVETNAVFSKNAIRPVMAGNVPEPVLPLVLPHVTNQEYILKAALECDYDAALKALMNDPNAKAKIDETQGRELLTNMIENTLLYLPEGWKKYCQDKHQYTYQGRTPLQYAKAACDTLMRKFAPEDLPPKAHFHYHQGVFLSGMERTYQLCGEEKYKNYIDAWVNSLVTEDGVINGFDSDELDDVQPGILLYRMYGETKDARYEKAIKTLMEVVRHFPKNREGGFWHKVKNKEQMWLDGLYMAGPFCALYGKTFGDPECFESCVYQALKMEEKTRDEKTGLLYHAWDSVRERPWADKTTGRSPEFWGRSIGWVPVAVLDELECMPKEQEGYDKLVLLTTRLLEAVEKYQDETGLWYQVVDKGNDPGNWLETSCSCLFAAAICKAVRMGFLPENHLETAVKAFEGVVSRLGYQGEDVIIGGICVGTGVGDFEHYCNRPTSENDLHGTGAFLLMCTEMEMAKNICY